MNNRKPQAISYMRFSAAHQSKGTSIKRQTEAMHRWLAENPKYELSNLQYRDEGVSGYKGDHLERGFGQLQKAIRKGEIRSEDIILIEAIDRLGRLEPLAMITLITPIVEEGVSIVTTEDGQVYSKESLNENSSLLFILAGKVQQAHEYSKRLSARITAANKSKREAAKAGIPIKRHTPVWLTSEGKLIPQHADMVNDCIHSYLGGSGTRQVIRRLLRKHPHLKTVHPTTLTRWFKNKALVGTWETKGGEIQDVFDPLIDKETYFQLQRELKRRTLRMGEVKQYDTSGLLICKKCGSRMHYRRKKHKDYVIVYSNCSQYLKRGDEFCDYNKTWPYCVVLFAYVSTFHSHFLNVAINSNSDSSINHIQSLHDEEKDLTDKIKKLTELASTAEGNIPEISDTISELSKQRESVKIKRAEIESEESSRANNREEILSSYSDILKKSPSFRRQALFDLGYRIEANDSKLVVNGSEGVQTFELIKRSTKYDCYFVEHRSNNKTYKLGIDNSGIRYRTHENISWENFDLNITNYEHWESFDLDSNPYQLY